MKYFEINKLNNVSSLFWIIDNNVYYISKRTNSVPKKALYKNEKLYSEDCVGFTFLNDFFFITTSKCKVEIIKNEEVQSIINGGLNLGHLGEKYAQLNLNPPIFDKRVLINLETQEAIKEFNKLDYWLSLEECINVDFEGGNYVISKDNLDTHEIIWSYDLRDLDKFNYMGEEAYDSCLKIIGNTTNELWVATKANRILVLDLHSGEMIYLLEFEPFGYYAPTARFASLVNDTIVMFHGSLTIIDCKTKTILTYKTPMDLGDDFSTFEVEDASQVQGDYVTFIATKKGSQYMKTIIGIFDYKNQKLAWLHEFPHDEKISISNPPVIEGNRLYALSYGHVLHVFEKEINEFQ